MILKYFLTLTALSVLISSAWAKDFDSALSMHSGELAPMTAQLQADVDLVVPQIRGFDEVYDVDVRDKTYVGTRIQWESVDAGKALLWTPARDRDDPQVLGAIMQAHIRNQRIQDIINRYTWYVSDRYIENYGNCARQNFMRAFDEFGTTILQPGQSININKLLAGLDGYCQGEGGEYMFYQGVCGFSTQVRRNALINPYLETIKRQNHGSRRQAYYGDDIVGDDAAIYEMDKQLEIRNDSDMPIYMRTLEVGGKKYLLSVIPTITDKTVEISRENIDRLTGRVIRTINDKETGEQIDRDYYISKYRGVIKGSN